MTTRPQPESLYARIGRQAGDSAARVASLLEDAVTIQYDASRKPGRPEDAGIRSGGVYSDPTGETAMDPLRLELRAHVKGARVALLKAEHSLAVAAKKLEAAMDKWAGELADDGRSV